jgi:hypothetical protein
MGHSLKIRFRTLVTWAAVGLAIAVSSCSNVNSLGGQSADGFGQCNGPLVDADVYLEAGPSVGLYLLKIVPVSVPNPGDVATITIANSNLGYRQLTDQVDLIANQEILAGYVSTSDLETFNILDISPFQPNTDFFSGNASGDTTCGIPQPGDDGSQSYLH